MATAYVGIGSNMGDRVRHCRDALEALARLPGVQGLRASPLYETEPDDGAGPRWFVNAVAALETDLTPEGLLAALQRLEDRAGRPAQRARGTDRTLDLDLLLYDDLVRPGPGLILPHPRMHRRRFVLAPLCALAPDLVHPGTGRAVRELLGALGPRPAAHPLGPGPRARARAPAGGEGGHP